MRPKNLKYGKMQKGGRAPITVTNPNDPRLKAYNDSLGLYNQSQQINSRINKKLPIIDKNKADSLENLNNTKALWVFDQFQYNQDKKNKKTINGFDNYVFDGNKDSVRFERNMPFGNNDEVITLSDGRQKHYITKDKRTGKVDKSEYDIYDPQTGTSKFYLDGQLMNISSDKIKPVQTIYRSNEKPIDTGGLSTKSSSTGWYDSSQPKPKFKTNSSKEYKNSYYPIDIENIYQKPVQPVVYQKPVQNNTKGSWRQMTKEEQKLYDPKSKNTWVPPDWKAPERKDYPIVPIQKAQSRAAQITQGRQDVIPTPQGQIMYGPSNGAIGYMSNGQFSAIERRDHLSKANQADIDLLDNPEALKKYTMKTPRYRRGGRTMQRGGQYLLDGSWSPGYFDRKSGTWVQTGEIVPPKAKGMSFSGPSVKENTPQQIPVEQENPAWTNPQPIQGPVNNPYTATNFSPEMTPEEIQKALEDVNNAPGNETQYFQTGWDTDPGNGQKTAKAYDANDPNATYQQQAHAEQNAVADGAGPKTINGAASEVSEVAGISNSLRPKKKINPFDIFLGLRGVAMGANFLSGIHARNQQDQYDYKQQTALGQMNPMPVSDFQYTPNHMYAKEGGMNPYSYHSKYGGNLKTIMRDYNKWSNDAKEMDMTDGQMKKGGYQIDDMVIRNYITKLFHFGKGPHPYAQQGGWMGEAMGFVPKPTPPLQGDSLSQKMISPLAHQLWRNGNTYGSINKLSALRNGNQQYKVKPKDIEKIKAELDNIGFFGRTADAVMPWQDIDLRNYKKGGWLKGAVNPEHKGWCTPLSNPHCTGHRRAFALMMKKNHGFHK